ncbi:hypothetical protein BaRGS_00024740 [Batillaria attramentaria]|uniref:Uncharacterized protein n=1 Tax=Batillaria attramentaria TaxID=370345 RepID=A0ABD0KA92_9CAEN
MTRRRRAGSPVTPGTGGDTDLLNDDGSHQNRLSDLSPDWQRLRISGALVPPRCQRFLMAAPNKPVVTVLLDG